MVFIGWMVFITLNSLFSFSGTSISRFHFPNIDKVVHFVFYFVGSLLGCLALREYSKGNLKIWKSILMVLSFLVIYGIIIEVIQETYTSTRKSEIGDVLANSLGALSGAIIIAFLFSGKRQLNWRN